MRWLTMYLLFLVMVSAQADVLTMGYRTNGKAPYIAESPSNAGFYADLYTEVARRMDMTLEIVREPKVRILRGIEHGTIDFYPVFTFTQERAKYSYWIANGIDQKDIPFSLKSLDDLSTEGDLSGLTQLVSLGNPEYLKRFDTSELSRLIVPDVDISKAIRLLRSNRADFYVYEEDALKYHIQQNGITDFKFHPDYFVTTYAGHTGLSRASEHFEGEDNPDFDPDVPISIENFPVVLRSDSVFGRMEQVLDDLQKEGFVDALYLRYFN